MATDERTTAELFLAALARRGRNGDGTDDEAEHARWATVAALHGRPGRDTFDRAVALVHGLDPRERLLGVDVLGQLGVTSRPYRAEAVPLLISALDDPDDDVAAAAGIALGHHVASEAVAALVAHAGHASAEVRLGVVHGLQNLDDPVAVDALIHLSADPDPQVRDWATFGLGEQLDVDTPAVRAALHARLTDADADVRAEALAGLTRRGWAPAR